MAPLEPRVIAVVAGQVQPSGSWVYVWVDRDEARSVYVGATGSDPELRTHLHLTSVNPELGRIRAEVPRFDERRFDILAFPLSAVLSRRAVKEALMDRLIAGRVNAGESNRGPVTEAADEIAHAVAGHLGGLDRPVEPAAGRRMAQSAPPGETLDGILIRAGSVDDAHGLAVLKDVWSTRSDPSAAAEIEGLARDLASWMTTQGDAVTASVAEHDRRLIGMAWLVVFPRVPDVDDRARVTGDLQSVFVLPAYRRRGVGRALIDSLLATANERGIPRVTVSTSASSEPLYRAARFEASPLLLEWRRTPGVSRSSSV